MESFSSAGPMRAVLAGTAMLAAACFGPDYPTGIPCSEAQTCPPGQVCDPETLICSADPVLAPPDAAPDAATGTDGMADPCAAAPCGPGTCTAAGDGYTCACEPGYEIAPGGETCVDTDECAAAPCGRGTCENRPGDYTCACEPGFAPVDGADGPTCADIDECAVSPDPCAPGGVCVNGEDQYACACNAGFVFDGQGCAPVLVGPGTPDAPRQWGDGTTAASCQEYRFPVAPYRYQGATGDGFYRIAPRDVPVTVFCDMTTDGGGWTAIDPAAAAALGGVATAVRAEGQTNTCAVQGGLLVAFYRAPGTGTRTLVCEYDVDLGFAFDTIRLSGETEPFTLISEAQGAHTTDIRDHLALDWGQGVSVGGVGDVLIGSASDPGPRLSLAVAVGALTAIREFAAGAAMAWPRDEVASTTAGTVLRVQLSESGSQDEGYRWTGGRIHVRNQDALPAPPAEARSTRP